MTKKTTKSLPPKAIPPTQNEAWGFWGTMANQGLDARGLTRAWGLAIRALVAVLGISPEQARYVLDARMGRHLADQVEGISEITPTIERLMRAGRQSWRDEAMALAAEVGPITATADAQTKAQFAAYLRETLIPDLRESGRDATADDFETALRFMGEGR